METQVTSTNTDNGELTMAHLDFEGTSVDLEIDIKAEDSKPDIPTEAVAEGDILDQDIDHTSSIGEDVKSEEQKLNVDKQETQASTGLEGALREDTEPNATKQENHTPIALEDVLNYKEEDVTKQYSHALTGLDDVDKDEDLIINTEDDHKPTNGEDAPSEVHSELTDIKQEDTQLSDGDDIPTTDSELTATIHGETDVGIVNEKDIKSEETDGRVTECIENEQIELIARQSDIEVPTDECVISNLNLHQTEAEIAFYTERAELRHEHLSNSELLVTGETTLSSSECPFTREAYLSDLEYILNGEAESTDADVSDFEQTTADEQCEGNKIETEEEIQIKRILSEEQGTTISREPEPEICAEQDLVCLSEPQSSQQTMDTDSRPPASCKFRYAKTIPTDTSSVIFYTSYNPKEPIVLTWSDSAVAYMSSEMTVACGDFHGNVHINGKTYPVEEFSVRSYSFEIDLYLTEDVIEDEVGANETQVQEAQFQKSLRPQAVDTFRDINSDLAALNKMDNTNENSIHLSSKYENLVRQQLSHKETLNTSLENELNSSHHSVSSSKQQTPIGDILQEHNLVSRHDYSSHNSSIHTPEHDVVQDFVENRSLDNTPVKSNYSSVRTTPHSEVIEDVLKSSYPQVSSRPLSDNSGSLHGLSRASPSRDKVDAFESQRVNESLEKRSEDERRSPSTHKRQTPDRQTEEIMSRTSQISRHTPVSEPIADVLEVERNTSPHRSSHASSRSTPQSEGDTPLFVSPKFSLRSPQKEVISDVLRSSQERLYENHGAARSGSRPSSSGESRHSASSRQQSMSSEQELSQYLDEPGNRGEVPRRAASLSGLNQTESNLPPIGSQGTASMPPLAGKRITTPDNHIRVPNNVSPAVRSPLITTRISTLSNDSRSSSRTVTPVGVENGTMEDLRKIQDLEGSVMNLRKLLCSRETEVHQMTDQIRDLRDINQSLCQELEHSKKQVGSFDHREVEREIATLRSEKEILASEVVKLQDRLKSSRNGEVASLDSYSPNKPVVLQRKIADLEGHIQDMQEVNETAVAKLTKAERQVRELTDENEKLRTSRSLTVQDLQDDNRRLEAMVRELKGSGGDFQSKTEMQQLKDDFCFTRDRNYRLNEENVQLKMEVGDLRHVLQTGVLDKQEASDVRQTMKTHTGVLDRPGHSLSRSSVERDRQSTHHDRHNSSREHGQYSTDVRSSDVREVSHDNGTSYGREEIYKKSHLRDSTERYPLTKENISSLERSFGSDKGRDEPFRQEGSYLDKYRIHGSSRERPKSEHSGFLHSSRPLPDGEVSEKIVQDGLKPSRLQYERTVQDVSPYRRDVDQDRRDYLTKSASKTAPLNSREIYRSVRERSHSHSGSHLAQTYLDSETRRRNPPLGDDKNHQRHISAGSDSTGVLVAGYPRKSTESNISSRHHQDVNYVREYGQDFDTRRKVYQDDPGEISDTATDILLRGEVLDKKLVHTKHWRRRSIDTDSLSSLSDADDEMISSRQRSKSVDARDEWRGKRTPTGTPSRTLPATQRLSASTERLAPGSVPQANVGFRSVTTTPLTTQHNKHNLSNTSLNSSLTHGLKPFAPRSPADINVEDVVKFSRQGGKLSQGTVKYVGHLPGRSDAYLGVELHKEEGKHDGTFDGIRYFKCKPNKGVFVAFNKVVMAWGF